MAGYWQKPQETAAALRDGWLHTGDVGTMDADGYFYLVDRLKEVIVTGGYKVYPRRVEEAIHRHPAVAEVTVVGIPDDYRSEEHTSELQSLMRISYAVFCLKKKKQHMKRLSNHAINRR